MNHFINFCCIRMGRVPTFLLFMTLFHGLVAQGQISTVSQLTNAINNGAANATITIGAGTFELTAPLRPKAGMTIKGAGQGKTIIVGAASWNPGTADLPDGEVDWKTRNRNAYLFDLDDGTRNVTISDMTLKGPQLHGAVLGLVCDNLELYNLHLEDFLWCGIRTFIMNGAKIHDNVFVDAAGTQKGNAGGALFLTYTGNSEFWNNDISYGAASQNGADPAKRFYGFKGREIRNSRLHHNTVKVDFSMEFPFEYDFSTEIDHNYLAGVISLPKYAGGPVPAAGGFTFHIHHNYFNTPYALEWPKNAVEVDHNLFNFKTSSDYGNLIANFVSDPASPGPTRFHDNLIKNPGRGIMWNAGPYNNFSFYNNHVIANTTITPRTEGFFEFPTDTDFSTIAIRDNIIECIGLSRPLMRNSASYAALIENNQLINVSDAQQYANRQTGAKQGPLEKLFFRLGANEKFTVDQWQILGEDPEPPFDPTLPQTLLTTQVPDGFRSDVRQEMGTKFESIVDGTITKVRIYTDAIEAGEHFVRLWRVADRTVLAGPYSWNITPGNAGWKEFTLPTAVAITANTSYIVAVSNGPDKRYAVTTYGSSDGRVNGNLLARGDHGTSSRTLGDMPTDIFQGDNYFRDVVFLAAPAAPPAPPTGAGTGLAAAYYNTLDLSGAVALSRTDTTVNFDWAGGSPGTGVNVDNFSARWNGQVLAPVTGSYTFTTTSDDGVRLWVNGQQLINNWTDHGPTNDNGTISLTAGQKYDIRLEYYERGGGATMRLQWAYSGQALQAIPKSQLFPAAASGPAPNPVAGLSGTYRLLARHSGKALDVSDASTADGARAIQWPVNGGASQLWRIEATDSGYYKLTAQHSGKALDVSGALRTDGAAVHQWTYVGGANQQWKIEATSDGYYKLTARHSGKALDVAGVSTADAAGVQQWRYGGGLNQQWQLAAVAQSQLSPATAASAASATVSNAPLAAPSLSAFPNPSPDGRPTLHFVAKNAQTVQVRVHNAQQQFVGLFGVRLAVGETDFRLPAAYPQGTFYLNTTIDGEKHRFTLKVE